MNRLLKRTLIRAADTGPFRMLLRGLERSRRRTNDRVAVLTYHRVHSLGENPDLDPTVLSATPEGFRRQMEFLAERYNVLGMPTLLRALSGEPLPPRSVLITFDDAYEDFAEHAWPVLRDLKLPVTLFVPTGFPDQDRAFWWDRIHDGFRLSDNLDAAARRLELPSERSDVLLKRAKSRIKSLPHDAAMRLVEQLCGDLGAGAGRGAVLNWRQLRELAEEGVSLAPHTRHHPIMTQQSPADALSEAVNSLEDLRRHIDPQHIVNAFAYPSGIHSDELARLLRTTEIEAAFTTRRRVNRLAGLDRMKLARINVGVNTPLEILRAQLVC